MRKKFKISAQENNLVRLFGEMTNSSDLSEQKPPLSVCYLLQGRPKDIVSPKKQRNYFKDYIRLKIRAEKYLK